MSLLLLAALSAAQAPAPAALAAAHRCELVTPNGEAVRFDVAAAAIGSDAIALQPVAGGAWPRTPVGGGRAMRPRPAARTYALGPNGGGLFVRFGDAQADGAAAATLLLGDRLPSLPVAHGLCAASADAAAPAASAPLASLDASAAAALDPRRWPAEDGCRLLTADRRRLSLTYFAADSRTVRVAVPGLDMAEQTVPRRASLVQNGVARARFGAGPALRGTDATYVHGAYAARLLAFETGPVGAVGICGLTSIVRVPSR